MSASGTDSVLYSVSDDGKVAYLTLNRPKQHNAINFSLAKGIRDGVQRANLDSKVHCIVLRGTGKGFCGGYDLSAFAELAKRGETYGSQDLSLGYDAFEDYLMMKKCTECYMALFHSYKPTIAAVHGAAVAGGSDIALCCDLVVMADDARIGYPPSRVWGCPTTAMWTYRVGAERAKRMLFTGDLISGKQAEAMGLILQSVPAAQLESVVETLCSRIKTVPVSQLFMQKQVINGVLEPTIQATQRLATLFDGITRNSPEGIAFQQMAQQHGFKAAVKARDAPGNTDEYRRIWKSTL